MKLTPSVTQSWGGEMKNNSENQVRSSLEIWKAHPHRPDRSPKVHYGVEGRKYWFSGNEELGNREGRHRDHESNTPPGNWAGIGMAQKQKRERAQFFRKEMKLPLLISRVLLDPCSKPRCQINTLDKMRIKSRWRGDGDQLPFEKPTSPGRGDVGSGHGSRKLGPKLIILKTESKFCPSPSLSQQSWSNDLTAKKNQEDATIWIQFAPTCWRGCGSVIFVDKIGRTKCNQ